VPRPRSRLPLRRHNSDRCFLHVSCDGPSRHLQFIELRAVVLDAVPGLVSGEGERRPDLHQLHHHSRYEEAPIAGSFRVRKS
jgi:hypothetical protein